MTLPLATGTYALLRGVGTDAYGDEVDADTVVSGYAAMVGTVVEASQATSRRSDGSGRDVRRYVGRFPASVSVVANDRIRDNATEEVYMIASWRRVANPVTGPVLRLDLRLVT
jgi:hypothetical protein